MGTFVEVSVPMIPGGQSIKFELDDDLQYRRCAPFAKGLMDYIPLTGRWSSEWGNPCIKGGSGETLLELRNWAATAGPALFQPPTPIAGNASLLGTWKCLPKPIPAVGPTGVWVGLAGKVSGALSLCGVLGGDGIAGCVVSLDRPEAILFCALDAHVGMDWGGSASLVGVLLTGYKDAVEVDGASRCGFDGALSLGPASTYIKEICAGAQAAAAEAKVGANVMRAEQLIAAVTTNSSMLVRNFKNIINLAYIDWERKKLTTFSGVIPSLGTEIGVFYYVGTIKVILSFNTLSPVVLPQQTTTQRGFTPRYRRT